MVVELLLAFLLSQVPAWQRQPGESCEAYALRVTEGEPPLLQTACCRRTRRGNLEPRPYWVRQPSSGRSGHGCDLSPLGAVPKGSEYENPIFFSDFESPRYLRDWSVVVGLAPCANASGLCKPP